MNCTDGTAPISKATILNGKQRTTGAGEYLLTLPRLRLQKRVKSLITTVDQTSHRPGQ